MAKPKKPKEKDYIPKSDAEFDKWSQNFVEKLPAIARKLGLPQKDIDEVRASHEKWHASYLQHLDAAYELARSTEIVTEMAFEMGKKEICKKKCAEILLIEGDERLEPFYIRAHEMLKKLEE